MINSVMEFELDNDGMEPSKRPSVIRSPFFILKKSKPRKMERMDEIAMKFEPHEL